MQNTKIASSITVLILLSLLMMVSTVSAESMNIPEKAAVNYYPARFDRAGVVNSIDTRGVIVDDVYISFSVKVQFMTPYDEHSSVESFSRGQRVGYILNKEKQITKFCLILEAEEGSS